MEYSHPYFFTSGVSVTVAHSTIQWRGEVQFLSPLKSFNTLHKRFECYGKSSSELGHAEYSNSEDVVQIYETAQLTTERLFVSYLNFYYNLERGA